MNATDFNQAEEELTVDKLASGDRPSIYALGLVGAQAIREGGIAVFMTDILGRVQLMSPEAIKIVSKPRITDKELDSLSEDEAIQILTAQEDSEETILSYLKERKKKME